MAISLLVVCNVGSLVVMSLTIVKPFHGYVSIPLTWALKLDSMKSAMYTNSFSASFLNFKKNLSKNLTFSVFGLKNRLKNRNKEIG
jgi:hypothetical protein